MDSFCPHCNTPVVRWRPRFNSWNVEDEYDMSNWVDECTRHCPLCRDCKHTVRRERVTICSCSYCLGEQRQWAKEAYDASPEGIAEAEEKRKQDADNARKQRAAELSHRAPKKGKGKSKNYESKPKGKNKRR